MVLNYEPGMAPYLRALGWLQAVSAMNLQVGLREIMRNLPPSGHGFLLRYPRPLEARSRNAPFPGNPVAAQTITADLRHAWPNVTAPKIVILEADAELGQLGAWDARLHFRTAGAGLGVTGILEGLQSSLGHKGPLVSSSALDIVVLQAGGCREADSLKNPQRPPPVPS